MKSIERKPFTKKLSKFKATKKKTVEVVIINGHGKAVKVTLSQEGWEAYKEDRRLHREQMSYQSLNCGLGKAGKSKPK